MGLNTLLSLDRSRGRNRLASGRLALMCAVGAALAAGGGCGGGQASTAAKAPSTAQTTSRQPSTTSTSPAGGGTALNETAHLTLVSKVGAAGYKQRGAITGTYTGDMTLVAKLTSAGVAVSFTVTTPDGTASGHGLAILRITGAALEPISGTVAITSGTGHFVGIHGRRLKVNGRVALDGSRGIVHLTGTVYR